MGRGKYHPPERPEAPSRMEYVNEEYVNEEYVNEVTSPVERAVKQFEQFVRDWTAPALSSHLFDHAVNGMRGAIRAIAPAADVRQIVGWAVFRYELNEKYDMAHVPVSPIFPKIDQARNSCREFNARKPGDHVICEVRSTT